MSLVDTHCHVHEAAAVLRRGNPTHDLWAKTGDAPDDIIAGAAAAGVTRLICVGTTVADSALAVQFVQDRPNCWASVGIHPHEAKDGEAALNRLAALLQDRPHHTFASSDPAESQAANQPLAPQGSAKSSPSKVMVRAADVVSSADKSPSMVKKAQDAPHSKIVAIGECGLDYFYAHSPKKDQLKTLRFQIELALTHDLPLIFHVREAFDDFWPVFDSYKGLRGVVHSFTDSQAHLDKLLARGLYVGVNGIATFTKNEAQRAMYKAIPLNSLVCETDAPFLTPTPLRGKVNVPANLSLVARFLAELRGESFDELAAATTKNAIALFGL